MSTTTTTKKSTKAKAAAAGAKVPGDRKAPEPTAAELRDGEALRVVEYHGHEYTVDLAAFDDIEVFEAFERVMSATGDEQGMVGLTATLTMLRALLIDQAQYERFKTEQKAVHGRVTSDVMQEFIDKAMSGN